MHVGLERGKELSEQAGLLCRIGAEPRAKRALELCGCRAGCGGAGAVRCRRRAGGEDRVWGARRRPCARGPSHVFSPKEMAEIKRKPGPIQ